MLQFESQNQQMAESKYVLEKRSQPTWRHPDSSKTLQLKLFNSLTREKEVFVPQFGKKISWYSCGPTVYDAAHMGHARSYISFDILRRILSNYFSYDIFYVMNITDIDDKIIRRARQDFLYNDYSTKALDLSKVIDDVKLALSVYEKHFAIEDDPDKKDMKQKLIIKTKSSLQNAENTKQSSENPKSHIAAATTLIEESKDILSDWLDTSFGNDVNDNSIFSTLPAKWEEAFFRDMDALKVLPPDAVTRVSEYIPEIIEYVEKIINNGLAYESNGSVYFDTIKFDQLPGHFYGKLVPEAFGDLKKLQEGEGDLSIAADRLNEKRSPSDFAVWKASKPGEPSWDSPWGKGRPGWHIECSVMASALLGDSLDIHTGGHDLKFPHHDNELAQAEAYFDNDHWVRYFLHSGHLTISGCKMSKSLKNFITIEEALKHYSARQLRFAFLLHSWKDTLDYSSKTMDMAVHYEKVLMEFFLNVKDVLRQHPKTGRDMYEKWGADEQKLNIKFKAHQSGVHTALCDNIDTRTALENIREIVSACNLYIRDKGLTTRHLCNQLLLKNVVSYVTRILKIFGTMDDSNTFEFVQETGSGTPNMEDAIMPHLNALANFRENVRQKAREAKVTPILQICDELRDDILPELGVRLEDLEGLKPVIKLVDAEMLLQERALKRKIAEEKQKEKEQKLFVQKMIQAEKEARKKIPPGELFKVQDNKYSKYDDKGLPTHDSEGLEISLKQKKKNQKLYDSQLKSYNEYLKSKESAEVL